MTLYHYITSDVPLTEVDLRQYTTYSVADILAMDPMPEPPIMVESWTDLHPEEMILVADSEDVLGGLVITHCEKPLAYVGQHFTQPYVYLVEGNFEDEMIEQLVTYCQQYKGTALQLWTAWLGDDVEQPVIERLAIEQLTADKVQQFAKMDFSCIEIMA